jgi:hypothetical protein
MEETTQEIVSIGGEAAAETAEEKAAAGKWNLPTGLSPAQKRHARRLLREGKNPVGVVPGMEAWVPPANTGELAAVTPRGAAATTTAADGTTVVTPKASKKAKTGRRAAGATTVIAEPDVEEDDDDDAGTSDDDDEG